MNDSLIDLQIDGGIATLTLNRPDKRNAISDALRTALIEGLERVAADKGIRALVLTGAGKGFSAGGDIAGMEQRMSAPTGEIAFNGWHRQLRVHRTQTLLHTMPKPVIAAVNGAAVGWGMELALYADIRIASEKAKFAELFIKRGLTCDVGGFYRLPAIVGPAKAAELLFTGDVIDAEEALRIGLVREVTPHAELMDRARALAARIACNPPLALRYMKEGLRRAAYGDPRELGGWAIETIRTLMKTEDHREGVASFLEKRSPVFTGR